MMASNGSETANRETEYDDGFTNAYTIAIAIKQPFSHSASEPTNQPSRETWKDMKKDGQTYRLDIY